VSAANRPEGGALFRVRLPAAPQAHPTARGPDDDSSQSGKRPSDGRFPSSATLEPHATAENSRPPKRN
jgi:hypothetical protein